MVANFSASFYHQKYQSSSVLVTSWYLRWRPFQCRKEMFSPTFESHVAIRRKLLYSQINWSRFKTTFLDIMEHCIPEDVLPNRKNSPWLNKEIIQRIRKRNHYFKKSNCSGSKDHLKFKKFQNKIVAKLRHAKCEFLQLASP